MKLSVFAGLPLLLLAVQFVSAATVDKPVVPAAFKDAGRKAGLEIWRIEKFEPVPVPTAEYGQFYEGDSYIVLSTKENEETKALSWDIHYWLGSETSQDESGAAAILTVLLDDSLGGSPVQHRELQGLESSQFLGYFGQGIKYLAGGVDSGFTHVVINAPGEKKFYQIKGINKIDVKVVEPSVKSMNKADTFILDNGRDVYIYTGTTAKGLGKLMIRLLANQIRDEFLHGRARVFLIDESSSKKEIEKFFAELGGGSQDQIADN